MFGPSNSVPPVRYPDAQLHTLPEAEGTTVTGNGAVAEPGMFFAVKGGARLMYAKVGGEVLYVHLVGDGLVKQWGGVWSQGMTDFANDTRIGSPSAQVAKNLAATQSVIKSWLGGFTTAVSCVGGPVAWGVFGMNVAITTGQVWRNWKAVEDGMVHLLVFEEETRKMKNFHDMLVATALFDLAEAGAWKVCTDLLEGYASKRYRLGKVAAKLTGAAVGAVGGAVFESRLKVVGTLLEEVFLPVADHLLNSAEANPRLSKEQIEQLAFYHVHPRLTQIRKGRAPFSLDKCQKMVAEFGEHGRFLGGSIRKILAAIKAIG